MIPSVLLACTDPAPGPGRGPDPLPEEDVGLLRETMDSIPLLGGTAAEVPALGAALFADPENDLLTLAGRPGVIDLPLPPGSVPFRVAVDGAEAWVTLRGTGAVVAVSVEPLAVRWAVPVCPEPRGVARVGDGIVVACAGGELVEIDAAGQRVREALVAPDLRDLVLGADPLGDDVLYVSRFRAAEVLVLDPDTWVVHRRIALDAPSAGGRDAAEPVEHESRRDRVARVAWRMRTDGRGGVVVSHQLADTGRLDVDEDPGEGSAYGGTFDETCTQPHTSTVTQVTPDGEAHAGPTANGVVLPVDFVLAGPSGFRMVDGAQDGGPVVTAVLPLHPLRADRCDTSPTKLQRVHGQPSALAAVGDLLILQTQNPAGLHWVGGGAIREIGERDPGAARFHTDPGVGMACASCHPEGLDDGMVWDLKGLPEGRHRKTMTLAGAPGARAPYHWFGELTTAAELVDDTLTGRMSGPALEAGEVAELFDWLDGLRPVRAHPGAPARLVAEGEEVFLEAGCAGCHAGELATNNAVVEVRVGGATKVPSLVGLGLREVLMRDGCAGSIEERLAGDPECSGGPAHGDTEHLPDGDRIALAAYLRSL